MNTYQQHIKSLALLGGPIVLGQLGSILQGFADTMMVGQYGTDELSAAGFTNNVFNLVVMMMLGFSYATTPVVGRLYGGGQRHGLWTTMWESVTANGIMSAVVVVLLILLYAFLDRLGQPECLYPLIRPYFMLLLVSLPFLACFNAVKQFCDGVGDTRTPMWVMIGGNIVNVILNYLFIFGRCGCPELGLSGAGVATLLSRVLMLMVMIVVVWRMKRYVSMRSESRGRMKPVGIVYQIRKGIPIAMQMGTEASSFNVSAIMMGWLGVTALAAHQVVCTIGTLCFMVYYGIGAAAAIRISHFRGQGEYTEVRRTSYAALAMTVCTGIVLSTLIVVLRHPLFGAFTTSDDVIQMCITMIPPFLAYQCGDCLQVIYANSLRAIESVKWLMWYAVVAYILVSIPLSYVFGFVLDGGAVGVWWAFPFGLTTAGVLFALRFHKDIIR